VNLFLYADNIALTQQARNFEECEIHIEEGFKTQRSFFHQWRLRSNPSKTEVCVFHLRTHNANRKLTQHWQPLKWDRFDRACDQTHSVVQLDVNCITVNAV
jgi:hypothetical protein